MCEASAKNSIGRGWKIGNRREPCASSNPLARRFQAIGDTHTYGTPNSKRGFPFHFAFVYISRNENDDYEVVRKRKKDWGNGSCKLSFLLFKFSKVGKNREMSYFFYFFRASPRGTVFSVLSPDVERAEALLPSLLIPWQIEREKKTQPLWLGGGSMNPDQAKARRRRRGFREIEKFPPKKKNGHSHPFFLAPTQRAFLLGSDIY